MSDNEFNERVVERVREMKRENTEITLDAFKHLIRGTRPEAWSWRWMWNNSMEAWESSTIQAFADACRMLEEDPYTEITKIWRDGNKDLS